MILATLLDLLDEDQDDYQQEEPNRLLKCVPLIR